MTLRSRGVPTRIVQNLPLGTNSENYTTHVLELPEGLIECDKLKLCGPSKCGEVRVSREFWGRRVDVRVVALLLFQAIWFIRQMHSRIVQDPVVQTPTLDRKSVV